ncbi:MAG: hypothetical protein FNP40_03885 [Dehalobacter sp. 4CP]|nr:hypothetical protein [Dehalobacter sp. 4CP]
MKTTVAQDSELTDLLRELRLLVVMPTSDGIGQPDLEMDKKKTADFLRATSRLAALAKEIAANGEAKREPTSIKERYTPMAEKAMNAANPETMELIRRDGERADVLRAKQRADETLIAFSQGKKKMDAAPDKVTNAAGDVEAARARADATMFKRRS